MSEDLSPNPTRQKKRGRPYKKTMSLDDASRHVSDLFHDSMQEVYGAGIAAFIAGLDATQAKSVAAMLVLNDKRRYVSEHDAKQSYLRLFGPRADPALLKRINDRIGTDYFPRLKEMMDAGTITRPEQLLPS